MEGWRDGSEGEVGFIMVVGLFEEGWKAGLVCG
jgi:hypothetical protein